MVDLKYLIKPKEETEDKKDKVEDKKNKNVGDTLETINATLDKILKSIISQGQSDKKRREKERSASEKRRSQERESGLEKPFQFVKNLASKVIRPFQGILDSVFRFLGFTFLGWLVDKFDEIQGWLSANKDKVNVVTRFLKDWWPALLGAYTLFFTPFGKLIRGTIRMVAGFTKQIIKHLAINPLKYLIRHPVVAAGVATGLATYGAYKWKEGEEKKLVDAEAKKRNVKPETVKQELETSKRSPIGMIGEAFSSIGPMGYARGGKIPTLGFSRGGGLDFGKYFSGIVSKGDGEKVSGYGKDTQMFPISGGGSAVLQPGETVLQVGARERMINEKGIDPLAYNKGSNANKPNKFTFKDGGIVGYTRGGVIGMVGGGSNSQSSDGGRTQLQSLRALLKGASLPSQGIRGTGLGGELRKGFHGTSKAAAASIRQANLYKDWQKRGLGFRSGSPQNYYLTRNTFFTPDYNVAERFATEATTEKRGILQRAFSRGVKGTGEVIDVAAPMGSGSFLRLPGATEQVVKPQTLTKGMRLMEAINQGKYARSAKAQQLLTRGYTTASLKGARGLGKAAGRFIPGVGIALGAADAGLRAAQGDWAGAGLSGLSMIPGPIGWGALAAQAGLDISRMQGNAEPKRYQGSTTKSQTIGTGRGGLSKPVGGRSRIARKEGGGITGATLGFTSKFGGQTNSMFGLTGGLNFKSGQTTGSANAMLGFGETMEGRTPKTAVDEALYSDQSNTGDWGGVPYRLPASKPDIKKGLIGSFDMNLSSSLGNKPQIQPQPQPPKTKPKNPPPKNPPPTTPPPSKDKFVETSRPVKNEVTFQNAITAAKFRLEKQGLVDASGSPYTGYGPATPGLTTQQIQDLILIKVLTNNRIMSRPNTKMPVSSVQNLVGYNSKVFNAYMNSPAWASYEKGGIVKKQKGGTSVLNLGRMMSKDSDYKVDPTLSKSIPLLYRMLQSGRFKEKGWGTRKFMDQLTARLLVESANFSRAREMYDPNPNDPKNKPGYTYFSNKYGGRSDLGNTSPEEGYTFRGRGGIQLTGKVHYQQFNKWLAKNGYKGIDVVKNPDLLATDPRIQALSTLYYLEDREKTFGTNFADIARRGDTSSFTYNINGGYNHLAETQDNLRRIQGLTGGVNYGTGFAPRSKENPNAKPSFLLNAASNVGDFFANFFSGKTKSAEKPKKQQGGGIRGFSKGGYGKVSTTSGLDIAGSLMGADTQLTALKPREYVIPSQVTDAIGEENLDRMVAKYDRNSNPAKSSSNLSKPLGPKVTYINLPDKVTKAPPKDGGVQTLPSPNLPQFSVVMNSSKREEVATALGIQDLI